MNGLIATPVDQPTGLPLPILPAELSKEGSFDLLDQEKNFHHIWHPNTSEELQGITGRALRYSAGWFIQKTLHRNYHELFYGPQQLPSDIDQKFRACVLSCAGIIPPQAINLSVRGEYEIVDLTKSQQSWLSRSGLLCIESTYSRNPTTASCRRNDIGRFFGEYAVTKSPEVCKELLLEEFLDPNTPPEQKRKLGNKILSITLNEPLSDIEKQRKQLKKEGYRTKVEKIHDVVFQLFLPNRVGDYHQQLESKLLTA